jgi:predicted protein tyrosine phosphatase
MRIKLLFVCARNQWRSPTAEELFRNHARYEARSAGTEAAAQVKITAGHIGWADVIFCMERRHADRIRERFAGELGDKPIIVLRIPDEFGFMDPTLIELLRSELSAHIEF